MCEMGERTLQKQQENPAPPVAGTGQGPASEPDSPVTSPTTHALAHREEGTVVVKLAFLES